MNSIITEIPQKILVIKQRQLGDVLMGTLALEELRKAYPDAQIDFLTEKKCAPIVENNPFINSVYLIDKQKENTIFKQIKFYRTIAKNKYDTVIALQTLPRVLLQVFFSKAKYRLGPYSKGYKNHLFTHTTTIEKNYPALENLEILKLLNIKPSSKMTGTFFLTDEDKTKAQNILKIYGLEENKRLITIDATHKDFRRAYPTPYYIQVLNYIQENIPDVYFFFLAGPGEASQVEACIKGIKDKDRIIFPKETPALNLSAAIMAEADYHIGACSFPRHLAVSLDIPSASLISISHTNWDIPDERHIVFRVDLPCKPCYTHRKCQNPRCINELYPDLIQDDLVKHILKYTKNKEI